jgi:hypothetical protein
MSLQESIMARQTIYRPDTSRPDRDELARDIGGRFHQVYCGGDLVCVYDGLAGSDLDPSRIVSDLRELIGPGGELEDLSGDDLVIWRGRSVEAVLSHSLTVTTTFVRHDFAPEHVIFLA